MTQKKMKVWFLTAEAAPFVKIGGLGDVAGTLPLILQNSGVDIRMVLPLHNQIDRKKHALKKLTTLQVESKFGPIPAEVYQAAAQPVPTYFIASQYIDNETPVYANDAALDGHKYVHFSLASLALVRFLDWQPDVVHGQDWHTAPALYALYQARKNQTADHFFSKTVTILTVHNLPYHGDGAEQAMIDFGLAQAVDSALPEWAQLRPLPLGLLAADCINTVSPGYAGEMLTEEFGAGLAGFLRGHKKAQLKGILNGLDLASWNPATDSEIAAKYSSKNLAKKAANKAALQKELGLPIEPAPLIGLVSRMDPQKGVDLIPAALHAIRTKSWQAILLGNGQPAIEAEALRAAVLFPNKVRTLIDFNAPLGRRIYAGADAFLIPSRYEPCGLSQMIAMRYGTVPVARAVGGLKDTITNFGKPDSTGFLFQKATSQALAGALRRALAAYADQPAWHKLQVRGMQQDFAWETSAEAYIQMYRDTLADAI